MLPGYGINTSGIKAIKSTYNAHKGFMITSIRGISKFLQAELEAGQVGVVDASGDRESMQKNPIKNAHEAQHEAH